MHTNTPFSYEIRLIRTPGAAPNMMFPSPDYRRRLQLSSLPNCPTGRKNVVDEKIMVTTGGRFYGDKRSN